MNRNETFNHMFNLSRKSLIVGLIGTFIASSLYIPQVHAAEPMTLPQPGIMVSLSPEFMPSHLAGITVHPDNALQFDFLINKGNEKLDHGQKQAEYKDLVKYFLASLTVTDDEQWVNLSPYEKNRIISDNFGKTEMGRDLLSQDYLLKQITSSLIYPETGLGKKFWDKIYERAWKEYGSTSVPVNTFNKVWIVPAQAVVYEHGNTAYILKSNLKVMLEEDYVSLAKNSLQTRGHVPSETTMNVSSGTLPNDSGLNVKAPQGNNQAHTLASKIIKEIILPEIEKEVNEGKNFARLRQIYSGMILATWYKKELKESLLGKIYADKARVKGVDQDPKSNAEIYQQYLKAFKKGVFNYIKEDTDQYTKEVIPRKYFSGGFKNSLSQSMIVVKAMPEQLSPNREWTNPDQSTSNFETMGINLFANREPSVNSAMVTATMEQRLAQPLISTSTIEQPFIRSRVVQNLNQIFGTDTPFVALSRISNGVAKVRAVGKPNVTKEWNNFFNEERAIPHTAQVFNDPRLEIVRNFFPKKGIFTYKKSVFSKGGLFSKPTYLLDLIFLDPESKEDFVMTLFLTKDKMDRITPYLKSEKLNLLYALQTLQTDEKKLKDALDAFIGSHLEQEFTSPFDLELVEEANTFRAAEDRVDGKARSTTINLSARVGLEEPVISAVLKLPDASKWPDTIKISGTEFTGVSVAGEKIYDLTTLFRSSQEWGISQFVIQREGETAMVNGQMLFIYAPDYAQLASKTDKAMSFSELVQLWQTHSDSMDATQNYLNRVGLLTSVDMTFVGFGSWYHTNNDLDGLKSQSPVGIEGKNNAAQVMTTNGGIDLNSANLDLQIKRDGKGVPLPINLQDLERLKNIEGFVPVIIDIKPVTELPLLSEIQQRLQNAPVQAIAS